VRGLERRLGAVVRHKALAWAEHAERSADASLSTDVAYNPAVDEPDLLAILGPPYWTGEEREREARPGLVYGLVVDGWGEVRARLSALTCDELTFGRVRRSPSRLRHCPAAAS
jgi:ATP-dependent Lon protease